MEEHFKGRGTCLGVERWKEAQAVDLSGGDGEFVSTMLSWGL